MKLAQEVLIRNPVYRLKEESEALKGRGTLPSQGNLCISSFDQASLWMDGGLAVAGVLPAANRISNRVVSQKEIIPARFVSFYAYPQVSWQSAKIDHPGLKAFSGSAVRRRGMPGYMGAAAWSEF